MTQLLKMTILIVFALSACATKEKQKEPEKKSTSILTKPMFDESDKAKVLKKSIENERVIYRANKKTKVLHAPGCKQYRCKWCKRIFTSKERAKKYGYKFHKCVK